MEFLHGIELRNNASATRLVRVGGTVYKTSRTFGPDPTIRLGRSREIHNRSSEVSAGAFMDELVEALVTKAFHAEAFSATLPYAGDGLDPEATFVRYWEQDALRCLDEHRTGEYWVAVAGLAKAAEIDPGAVAWEAHITTLAHTRATDQDLVISPAAKLAIIGPDAGHLSTVDAASSLLVTYTLGPRARTCPHADPVCSACDQYTSDLLEYLVRGVDLYALDAPARHRILAAAQRLMLLSHPALSTS